MYACLAVTCHLHFWQNDRDLLRATAVNMGDTKYPCVCRIMKLQGRGVHSENRLSKRQAGDESEKRL